MNQAETLKKWQVHGGLRKDYEGGSGKAVVTPAQGCPCVLSFTSGKGGVGKTNIVTNIALALAQRGKRVLILDADLGLANVDVLLGLAPTHTIKHVLSGERTLEDILLRGPGGILILPAGSGVPELVDLSDTEKLFLLTEMEELGDSVDVLLIDTSAGISENVLYFNIAAERRVVVVTPEPTSVTDAYALIKVLAGRHHIRTFSILINWAKNGQEAQKVFHQLSAVTDRFLGPLSLGYLGFVPHDDAIPRAVRRQRAVLDIYPEATSSRVFMDLAQNLIQERYDRHVDGNIKFFWKRLLKV